MSRRFCSICIVLLTLFRASIALADGMFVWRNQQVDIHEPEQKAVLFWDGGHEDLVLSVKFEGAPKEFGWIVPLPTVPELSPDDPLLFEELSQATQERPRYRLSRLARAHMTAGMTASVEVLKRERVGLYDTTVLKASDGASLQKWLRRHRFRLPRQASTVLDRYIERDWVFVAMKIAPDAPAASTEESLRSGTIHPIRFRFPSEQPVYPLEISSVLSKDSDVLLYVISKKPVVPPDLPKVRWERFVSASPSILQRASTYFTENPHRDRACVDEGWGVTKARTRFSPDAMQDLVFVPFDLERALNSDFTMERLDAVGVVAHLRPANAEELLLSVLRPDRTNLEKIAALWGLAQLRAIRDPRPVQDLIDDSDPEVRLQALEALEICRSPSASVSALKVLKDIEPPPPYPQRRPSLDFTETNLFPAAIEILIAQGDLTCVEPLRMLVDQCGAYDQLMELERPVDHFIGRDSIERRSGIGLLVALAACGNESAQRTIEKSLTADLRRELRHPLLDDADSPICTAILRPGQNLGEWPLFSTVDPLLARKPEARDATYRRIAYASDLPDLSRIVLLSRLSALDRRDTRTLLRIWRKKEQSCAAAFALAKQKEGNALRTLWSETAQDPIQRGHVAHAIASSEDSTLAEPLLEYVRNNWDPRFRSTDWRTEAEIERMDEKGPGSLVFHSVPPDFDTRTRAITRFLTAVVPTEVALRPLTSDRSLDPMHRLFWIEVCDFSRISHENLWGERIEALRAILRDSEKHDPLASSIAREMLAHHERLQATFAAQEKDRAARAAGVPVTHAKRR